MTRRRLPQSLMARATEQRGLLSRRQLSDAGLTAAVVRNRLLDEWRLVLPGVVLLSRLDLDRRQQLVAAQLFAGASAVVTGAAAVHWHGLAPGRRDPGVVDVLVPHRQASRSASFVRVHRSRRPAPARHQDGIVLVAAAERAVADAVRFGMPRYDAHALVIRAVQTRAARLDDVTHELYAGPRRGSAALRTAVSAAATGAWSAPEHDLLVLLATSRTLPHAWPNPELRTASGALLPTPDAWFDDVGLAVQVHSAAHHSSGPDWDRTVRSDSALAEAGVLRISVTPREIATEAAEVLGRIEALHRSRRPADRPRVAMIPRGPGLA